MKTSSYSEKRTLMVSEQISARGITDQRVLSSMGMVKRELFVPEEIRAFAYHDGPLPIECGQTISQPYIVACMAELLDLSPQDKVLEIGTGSGYNAAVLSLLAKEVYTIEIHEPLAKKAQQSLMESGRNNVLVKYGDGQSGWRAHSPFNGIILTAACAKVPPILFEQLKIGGKLIAPEGGENQFLFLYHKKKDEIEKSMLMPVRFMQIIGGNAGKHQVL